MLNTSREIRVFGFRYITVFTVLAVSGTLIGALLILAIAELPSLAAGRTQVMILAAAVGAVFVAMLVAARAHDLATRQLADVRTTSKAILESLAGGVLTLDADGHITIINRAASRILEARSRAPYPTLEELALRHPAIVEFIQRALWKEEYVHEVDSSVVNSGGRSLTLRTTVSAQLDENGDRTGLVVLVKDVSKMIALEQELRKRDRLAAAGSLAAGVAHEIRNPLSALELNLRLLHDEVAQLPNVRLDVNDYFEILFVETQRLNRITTSFLQLSRPDAMSRVRLLLEGPIIRILRLLEPEAKEKRIEFETSFADPGMEILGDATKLEQVCLNILINAMQAMPGGGTISVATRLRSEEDADWVDLVIVDQGTGVLPENVDRLFDPYFTTRNDGTGLGLAIADRIVADHGGTITVETAPGKGTTMTLQFPVAPHTPARRN
jgi:signal transduction histidine kinase